MLRAFVRAVWTICKKDLRVWLHQPANVAITVVPAFALLFIDALAAGAVGRSPVALVTLDHGVCGQQMARIIHQADLFRVSDATPAQAQAMYQNLDVVAILTIPANFTQAVEAHAPAPLEVQINNLNTDFTNDIRRAVPDAITQFYQQQGGESPIKVTLQEQNLQPGHPTLPVQRDAPAGAAARRERAGLQQSRGGGRMGDAHDQRAAPVAGE